MAKQKVLVIVGPTASGKSALAVRLAKKLKGEIVSADSRQVYKGLDIGTGKITRKEMGGVPHHLLDVADPKKQFSVSDYLDSTLPAIAKIVESSKLPIIVGGTGFYIDALTGRVAFPDVPPDKALRRKLDRLSKEKLFGMLAKKDPRRASTIDPHNKVRLIRALEIIEKYGSVPQLGSSTSKSIYSFVFIGIKPDNLDERIHMRLLKRLPGMIKEARKLVKLRKLSFKRMRELGLEYRYIGMYLQGKISKTEMIEKLNTAICQYAKRQMTWFKRNKKIRWFTLLAPTCPESGRGSLVEGSAVEGFKPEEYRDIEKYIVKSLGGR
ncbi:MAG: tRNA (adenosine(37)-N6)-dimethylallyltransferase MiaA [bacterium]|nr:tRNA (adenosine(37)-N6)-dimethylallyltransferase MiaA [bacterium]